MSTLFMIGNGFDINCGLKTSFSDVCKAYVKTESKSKTIAKFKDTINSDIDNWSDFEITMGENASIFETGEEFLECVYDFIPFLKDYITNQEQLFYDLIKTSDTYSASMEEMGKSIESFSQDVSGNVDVLMKQRKASNYNIIEAISFNYTKVFDFLLSNRISFFTNQKPHIHHIHGNIETMTLGVDNEKQIKANFPITKKIKRSFIKPFFNEEYDSSRIDDANKMIESADTICIFGMSLGLSDLTWRNKIIEWLRMSPENQLFIYDYAYSSVSYSAISERMGIAEDAVDNLLDKWEVSNKSELVNQVNIVCGKNIFNIEKAINKAVEETKSKKTHTVMAN